MARLLPGRSCRLTHRLRQNAPQLLHTTQAISFIDDKKTQVVGFRVSCVDESGSAVEDGIVRIIGDALITRPVARSVTHTAGQRLVLIDCLGRHRRGAATSIRPRFAKFVWFGPDTSAFARAQRSCQVGNVLACLTKTVASFRVVERGDLKLEIVAGHLGQLATGSFLDFTNAHLMTQARRCPYCYIAPAHISHCNPALFVFGTQSQELFFF